jgi:hypothetical protein
VCCGCHGSVLASSVDTNPIGWVLSPNGCRGISKATLWVDALRSRSAALEARVASLSAVGLLACARAVSSAPSARSEADAFMSVVPVADGAVMPTIVCGKATGAPVVAPALTARVFARSVVAKARGEAVDVETNSPRGLGMSSFGDVVTSPATGTSVGREVSESGGLSP